MVESSYEQKPNKDSDNDGEVIEGKTDLWTPLNCLVEVANRTKSSKSNTQGLSAGKLEPDNGLCINDYKSRAESSHASDDEIYTHKTKMKEPEYTKVKNKSKGTELFPRPAKRKRIRATNHNKAASSRKLYCASAQAMLDASQAQNIRQNSPIWFSLIASEDR